MHVQKYWQGIRRTICTQCPNGDVEGNCCLDPSIECGLEHQLPLIAGIVERIDSVDITDYARELRFIACAHCRYQTVNGYCALRYEVDCALDKYFPSVVKILQHLRGSQFKDEPSVSLHPNTSAGLDPLPGF